MKTKITLAIFMGFLMIFSVQTALTSGSGAPQGHTGSPGDGANCSSCHSGSPTTLPGLITSNIPASGYVPGTTYLITATISHPTFNKFGFQISPQNSSGALMGTIATNMPSGTQILSGKWITHTSSGTAGSGNSKTWTFYWTAPTAGSGPVTFYGAFNCANANNNTSGDVIRLSSLTVQPAAAPLTVTPFPIQPSCAGPCNGSVSVSITGGTPPYLITWSNGANGQVISNLCAGTYTAVITDGSGASTTSSVTLTSPPPASVVVTVAGNTVLCSGDCVVLSLVGTYSSYQWSNGANSAQISVCIPGTYSVSATDPSGCIVASNTVTVTSLPSPGIPTISESNFVLSSTAADSYQWLLNGSPISGANQQSYTAIQNGDYRVIVTNVEGCSDTSAVYAVNSISMEESDISTISAYPNPFINSLYFNAGGHASISDLSGRSIFIGAVDERIAIETKSWPSGMYIVEFTDHGGQKRHFRLVKP